MTTYEPQSGPFEYTPPFAFSSSSTRNGTTSVRPTPASSVFVKPVTCLPATRGLPSADFTWRSTPGAWQTSATGLPASMNDSIKEMELPSSARSHKGPWPPG
ncbi:hypothetical protein D3C71_1677060 [compost metagenome]